MDAIYLHSERACRQVQSWIGDIRIMEGKRVTVCSMEDIHTNWTPLHYHLSLLTSFPIKLCNFPRDQEGRGPKKSILFALDY